MNKTGELLTKLRKDRNLTQQAVADALHISDKTISKWERGEGLPEVGMLLPLADFYGVTVDEILRGEIKEKQVPHTPIAKPIDDLKRSKLILLIALMYNLFVHIMVQLPNSYSFNMLSFVILGFVYLFSIGHFIYAMSQVKSKISPKQRLAEIIKYATIVISVSLYNIIFLRYFQWFIYEIENTKFFVYSYLKMIPPLRNFSGYMRALVPVLIIIGLIYGFVCELIKRLIFKKKSKLMLVSISMIMIVAATLAITPIFREERYQYAHEENYQAFVKDYKKTYEWFSNVRKYMPELKDINQTCEIDNEPMDLALYFHKSGKYDHLKGVIGFNPEKLQITKYKAYEQQFTITHIRNAVLIVEMIMGCWIGQKVKQKETTKN